MRIDAHQHFWKYNSDEYSWISPDMKVLRDDFLPDKLLPELDEAGIEGTVVIQARQTLEETRWLLQLSEENSFIKGVVGWVDLCSGNLKEQLDEFTRFSKFKGVRHVIHDEPDESFMLRRDFLNGISILQNYNLTYDLLLFPKHLPVAGRLVSMFPGQKFVLDHISKPLIRQRIVTPWKDDLLRIAEHNNIFCKISGMVTEADRFRQKDTDFYPYLDIVFKAFEPERLMFGSDWPVCLLVQPYQHVAGLVEGYLSKMSPAIRQNIMGESCCRFYGL